MTDEENALPPDEEIADLVVRAERARHEWDRVVELGGLVTPQELGAEWGVTPQAIGERIA